MKNQFKGYYTPKSGDLNKAWKSNETLFVFDTNIFLNLYSYAEKTREDFFELLEEIKEQLWIPYHVGLEYQKRRLTVIRNEKAVFNKIDDSLVKIEKVFNADLKQLNLERRFPKLNENTEKLEKEILKSIANFKKSLKHWDDKQPCVRSHDGIRKNLNKLFDGKVGLKPKDQEEIDLIQEEGEKRYENQIPPGYKDSIKDKDEESSFTYDDIKYQRKFGDLILWNQIINKAKEDNIKNIIFVTDDAKEDWWYIINSRGKKRIGPHANLQSEIYSKSEINLFHMYNTSLFLEEGKKALELGISDSSITEIDNLYKFKISERLQREITKKDKSEKVDDYNNIITKINLSKKADDKNEDSLNHWFKDKILSDKSNENKSYSIRTFENENSENTKENYPESDSEKLLRLIRLIKSRDK
jgi:hypothetical protein